VLQASLDIDIETQVLSSGLTLELHLPQAAPQSNDDDNVCAPLQRIMPHVVVVVVCFISASY